MNDLPIEIWFTQGIDLGVAAEPQPTQVGGKGAGLLSVPPGWVPDTVFLSPKAHEFARSQRYSDDALDAVFNQHRVGFMLSQIGPSEKVIVRSDAASESIIERGRYSSLETYKAVADIVKCAKRIWSEADNLGGDAVGLLIQPLLSRRACGHISNEQRLNRNADSWTVEMVSAGIHHSIQWSVSDRDETGDRYLACASLSALMRRLRSVAAHYTNYSPRHHLEWVWDGMRLWVVQADPVIPLYGPPPGELWRPRTGVRMDDNLQMWTELTPKSVDELIQWPKVRALQAFTRAHLPTHQIWCLTDTEWLARDDSPPMDVLHDLELLMTGHTVIRTDVAHREPQFMLPKTKSAITDPKEALDFMKRAVATVTASDPRAEVAFLAHRFLRSRASAWSYAVPRSPQVTIDAIWGLADGLGWLPHDKFVVDLRTESIRHSIRAKTHFLDVSGSSGDWEYRQTPSDWIWRWSISESQILAIARGAWAMAQSANSPQLTMWFAGLLDGPRLNVLPWFQTGHAIPLDERPPEAKGRDRVVIRDRVDLDRWLMSESRPEELVVLEPGDALLRDKEFVSRIAASSKVRGACIEILGSPLAHPFYLLTNAGATVVCPMPQVMETVYDKLVRDRVPEKIESAGEHVSVIMSSGRELEELLRQKIVEEAFEVAGSTSVDSLVEELADLAEVVRSLLSVTGVAASQVEAAREAKLKNRGGFASGVVLRKTSTAEILDVEQETLPGLEPRHSAKEIFHVQGHRGLIRLDRLPARGSVRRTVEIADAAIVIEFEFSGREVKFRVEPIGVEATSNPPSDEPLSLDFGEPAFE